MNSMDHDPLLAVHVHLEQAREAMGLDGLQLFLPGAETFGQLRLDRSGPVHVGHLAVGRVVERMFRTRHAQPLGAGRFAHLLNLGPLSVILVATSDRAPRWGEIRLWTHGIATLMGFAYATGRLPHPPVGELHEPPFLLDPSVADLVPQYLAERIERLQTLRGELLSGTGWASVRLQAHRLKGSGGMYGFPALSQLAGVLVEAAEAEDVEAAALAVDALDGYLVGLDSLDSPWRRSVSRPFLRIVQ